MKVSPEDVALLPAALREKIIAALGLVPVAAADAAEGAQAIVTDEQIAEALNGIFASAESVAGLNETITANGASLEQLNAELEKVRGEYQALFEKQETLEKAKRDAEVEEILASFADRGLDEAATARIRTLLLSDRESGLAILNGLPKPSAATTEEEPPEPQHDPARQDVNAAPSEDEIAIAIRKQAEALMAANKKLARSDAWSQAETEIRAKVARGEALK